MTATITPKQAKLLHVLHVRQIEWLTGVDLAALLDTPAVGAHMTAASLVRRGLAVKSRRHGLIHYQITAEGRKIASFL